MSPERALPVGLACEIGILALDTKAAFGVDKHGNASNYRHSALMPSTRAQSIFGL